MLFQLLCVRLGPPNARFKVSLNHQTRALLGYVQTFISITKPSHSELLNNQMDHFQIKSRTSCSYNNQLRNTISNCFNVGMV